MRNRRRRNSARSDHIRDRLRNMRRMYESDVLPYGTFSRLATEFGVTRARVQQLAKELGLSSKAV